MLNSPFMIALVLLTLLSASAHAQQSGPVANTPQRPPISEQDRTEAQQFVAEHHPELASLLSQLQKSRPAEFERALRELVPQTQAIQRSKERSPARYESLLAAWKVDSQIRVLMARWSRKQDPETETKVRELIAQRQQLRREQTQAEKQRLTEQLQKLDEQLQTLEQPETQRIQAEWEQLSRRATTAAKQAAKQKSTPTAGKSAIGKQTSAKDSAAAEQP
ncbi:MAG: hypothetical protein RIT02_1471 [Planctomycetota bacterium]|jgi:hypothetical protein